jgi:hypothetical protein
MAKAAQAPILPEFPGKTEAAMDGSIAERLHSPLPAVRVCGWERGRG